MSSLKLYLFGSPRLEWHNSSLKITRRKAMALLSYLAVTAKPHERDALATLLWPENSQSQARMALSRHLSELNKLVPEDIFILDAEMVSLSGPLWLDVAEFTTVLRACAEVTKAHLPILQTAATLYHDDFLAGFTLPDCPDFDSWQFFQAERLRQQFASTLEKLVHLEQRQGDDEGAIAHAQRWLALDPLNEPVHRALMTLYAQTGQLAAALRQYQLCQQTLADELGVAPAEETAVLYERIRAGDYGRGAGERERFAFDGSRGKADVSPPLPLTPAPLHNLPAQTTPFIGRERELAELTGRLTDPDTRLVTIIGLGGMGKTRLAQQAGWRLVEQDLFQDGVWFLSLAAVDANTFGPALNPLLNGLAGLFGLRLHGGSSPQEQVLAYLQGRQMLLIFDNLEHLLTESEVLSELLRGAPEITLLTTSRERLNLQEEWLFPLEGLALTLDQPPSNSPQSGENHLASPPLGGIEGGLLTEAVQLFQQTAQRLQPGLELHPHLNAVAQICRLVEGLPLGIELAASWVRYMSPAEIAQEIEKDIDFLATNVRNLPPRHRSLRAVFDHSWRLLSPPEQEVLPQLALFRGSFRLAEAQAVTGAARSLFTGFVDKSLVSVSAEGRYDLHERLRQYLLEELRQDLAVYQAANDRHSQVYLALLQLDHAELARQKTLQRLTEDFDNIRVAWHWALDHANWSAIRQARRELHIFCLTKSLRLEENAFYERTIRVLEQHRSASQRAQLSEEAATEAELLLVSMRCHYSKTQADLGIYAPDRQMMLDENLNILRAMGPAAYPELVEVLNLAIFPYRRRLVDGHVAQRRYSQEALTLSQTLGDGFGQRIALRGLGFAALFAGQLEAAARYTDQLLALAELAGNATYQVTGLSLRAYIAIAQGDYLQAANDAWQCHQLAVSIDPEFPILPFSWADRANVARLQGDYAQAQTYLQQAAKIEHTLRRGHAEGEGARQGSHYAVLLVTGYLAETQGELVAATEAFEEIWQQDRNQSHFSAAALIGLGWVALHSEDWSAARQHFAAAFPLIEQLETAPQALEALAGVAHLQAQAGQLEQALALIGLVYHHPSSYQESKDRLAGLEAELQTVLSPEQVQAALARGQAAELWATVAAVQAEL